MRQRVFEVIIDGFIDACEGPAGEFVVPAILSGKLNVLELVARGKEIKDGELRPE